MGRLAPVFLFVCLWQNKQLRLSNKNLFILFIFIFYKIYSKYSPVVGTADSLWLGLLTTSHTNRASCYKNIQVHGKVIQTAARITASWLNFEFVLTYNSAALKAVQALVLPVHAGDQLSLYERVTILQCHCWGVCGGGVIFFSFIVSLAFSCWSVMGKTMVWRKQNLRMLCNNAEKCTDWQTWCYVLQSAQSSLWQRPKICTDSACCCTFQESFHRENMFDFRLKCVFDM